MSNFEPLKSPYKNVNEAFEDASKNYPDNVAIAFYYQDKETIYTYKDLSDIVLKFANGLKSLGFNKGDHIGIVLANVPEFVISFYSIMKIGAVGCSIIKILKPNEIADISKNAELKGLIINSDKKRVVKKCLNVTPSLKHVITVGDKEMELEGVETHKFWEVVEELGSLTPINVDVELDDWATINFTSGTTEKPKGTIYTNRNYVYAALAQKLSTKLTPEEVIVLV